MKIFDTPFATGPLPEALPGQSWPKGLWRFMWRCAPRQQIIISAIALTIAVLTVAPIELQRSIVNKAIEDKSLSLLLWLGGGYLIAILALQAAKFLFGNFQNYISQTTILRMRRGLYPKCEGQAAKLDQKDSGNSVSVLGSETDQVGEFVGTGISDLVADSGKLIFAIGYMLWVEPLVTLVALAFFIPQVIIVPLIQKRLNRFMRERTDLMRELSDDVSKAADGEPKPESFEGDTVAVYDNRAHSTTLKYAMKALVNLINSLAPLSVLIFGGYLFIEGSTTLGTIVAFTAGFERMAGPGRALVDYYRISSLRNEQYGKIVSWDVAAAKG